VYRYELYHVIIGDLKHCAVGLLAWLFLQDLMVYRYATLMRGQLKCAFSKGCLILMAIKVILKQDVCEIRFVYKSL
jgi:hypothetical protein